MTTCIKFLGRKTEFMDEQRQRPLLREKKELEDLLGRVRFVHTLMAQRMACEQ